MHELGKSIDQMLDSLTEHLTRRVLPRMRELLGKRGGGGRIRTFEGRAVRFTV